MTDIKRQYLGQKKKFDPYAGLTEEQKDRIRRNTKIGFALFCLLLLGPSLSILFTNTSEMTLINWQKLVAGRLICSLGGFLLTALFIVLLPIRSAKFKYLFAGFFLALGLLLNINPLWDMTAGVKNVNGVLSEIQFRSGTIPGDHRRKAMSFTHTYLIINTEDQKTLSIQLGTHDWNKFKPQMNPCQGKTMQISYLRRLERVLDFKCSQ